MRIKRMSSDVGEKVASMAIWMLGLGVLLTIWGGVWLVYLYRNPPDHEVIAFVATGVLLSGLDLGLIGLASGKIGRAAREAEESADQPDHVAVITPDRRGEAG